MNKIVKAFSNLLLNTVSQRGGGKGWMNIISEPYSGAWQRNDEISNEGLLAYPAVFACITLIAGDISKLGLNLMKKDSNDVWVKSENSAYSPVLRKPNRNQTRLQFYENWLLSILTTGNTYILKERDDRKVVVALHILDPCKVQVLVSSEGEVFYQLSPDNFSGVDVQVTVPSSEIIHDRMNCLYHPLIGMSPIQACASTVLQGSKIQTQSSNFFSNGARPGGILIAPGALEEEDLRQMKLDWENNYSGNNAGRVAVLADGLEYKEFATATAQNSQLIEQLKWTAEVVCMVFHIPPYMVSVGPLPNYNNVQALNQQYYSQVLQKRIEHMEALLDEGLGLSSKDYRVEFELDDLLRMDTKTLMEVEELAVSSGIKEINESRKRINLGPTVGGDAAYLQQQNYSLAALARRDSRPDLWDKQTNTNNPAPAQTVEEDEEEVSKTLVRELRIKALERFNYE